MNLFPNNQTVYSAIIVMLAASLCDPAGYAQTNAIQNSNTSTTDQAQPERESGVQTVEGTPVPIPGTKVSLVPPEEFIAATSFAGFQHLETGSSIMVVELPGPMAELRKGFDDPRALASQGISQVSKKGKKQGPHPGMLYHFSQKAEGIGVVEKWIWLFGSDKEGVLVMGICPVSHKAEIFDPLLKAVSSARWELDRKIDPFEGLGFSLRDQGSLQFFSRTAGMVGFTLGGKPDAKKNGQPAPYKKGRPMFVIGPAIASVQVDSPETFARRLLEKGVAGYKHVTVNTASPIQIDDLRGIECVANATDDDGFPASIYQAVLLDGSSYWRAVGSVAERDRAKYLPMFRRMARSFQRNRTHIKTQDGSYQVTVRGGWSVANLSEDTELQVAHATAECYLIVYSEEKSDLEVKTLQEYSDVTRASLKEEDATVQESAPKALEIGGQSAIQSIIHRSEEGKRLVYLHTVIEDKQHYHQLFAWGLATKDQRSVAALQSVVKTFRRVE